MVKKILVGALILLGVVILARLYIPTLLDSLDILSGRGTVITSNASWKTYKNLKFGLRFDYPPGWTLREEENNSGFPNTYRIIIKNPKSNYSDVPNIEFEISQKDILPNPSDKSSKLSAITVDGANALRVSRPGKIQNATETITFKKNINFYRISLLYEDAEERQIVARGINNYNADNAKYEIKSNEDAMNNFDKLISSLHFIE